MANVSNFIKVTKAQYDILVNGGSITKGGTTYTYDNNALYLVEEDFSYLYNSGKFDTYPYNSDRSKVLRQTGYLYPEDLVKLNWIYYNGGGYDSFYALLSNGTPVSSTTEIPQMVSNIGNVVSNNGYETTTSGIAITIDNNKNLNIRPNASGVNSVETLKAWILQNNLVVQYKTTTSYTDDVIENQPLLTLDQNGCNFLKQEWEKGLNLLPPSCLNTSKGIDGSGNLTTNASYNAYYKVPVIPNTTYTISYNGNGFNMGVATYNSSGTFVSYVSVSYASASGGNVITIPGNVYYISFDYPNTYSNNMMNYTSHAYPYQAYNGALVREKDLEPESIPQGTVNEALGYDTDGKLVRGTAGGGGSQKYLHNVSMRIYRGSNWATVHLKIFNDESTEYTAATFAAMLRDKGYTSQSLMYDDLYCDIVADTQYNRCYQGFALYSVGGSTITVCTKYIAYSYTNSALTMSYSTVTISATNFEDTVLPL